MMRLSGWEFFAVVLLCILCLGDPDLLDALIKLVFSWVEPCANVTN
jgi:hypothetical protein